MTLVIERAGAIDALRRVNPSDVDELVAMHERCSPQTRYARWHGHTKRFPQSYLARLLADDIAVVARRDGMLIGLGSAARVDSVTWEIGLLVEDGWQRRGVGGQLLTEIVELAHDEGAKVIRAEVLEQDAGLLQPLRALGPLTVRASHGVMTADVHPWA
ncbi:MAG TPA: GNAT family N-acetyltransferase [Jatrophihabitantaceae bacterium]|nr:GNAT family N-acetyltransferase [Jatrophihabitantaceae bacterium]